MTRKRTRAERKKSAQRQVMTGVIVAVSNATQNNLRSALGLQLLRLWMYDPRDGLTRAQRERKFQDSAFGFPDSHLAERGNDYQRIY